MMVCAACGDGYRDLALLEAELTALNDEFKARGLDCAEGLI
jgi:hypothetical protein